jgi:hypothetical protein
MAISLPQRVPENAPGDFYVIANHCMQCCIPHGEAPELLNDPEVPFRECYFRRQPQNEIEVEHAVRAARVSCTGALRYAGDDPKILARLQALHGPNAREAWAGGQPSCGRPERTPQRSWWRRLFGGAG